MAEIEKKKETKGRKEIVHLPGGELKMMCTRADSGDAWKVVVEKNKALFLFLAHVIKEKQGKKLGALNVFIK